MLAIFALCLGAWDAAAGCRSAVDFCNQASAFGDKLIAQKGKLVASNNNAVLCQVSTTRSVLANCAAYVLDKGDEECARVFDRQSRTLGPIFAKMAPNFSESERDSVAASCIMK